jgi:hypothetical protein
MAIRPSPALSISARKRRACIDIGRYDRRIEAISAYGHTPDLRPIRHDNPESVSSN